MYDNKCNQCISKYIYYQLSKHKYSEEYNKLKILQKYLYSTKSLIYKQIWYDQKYKSIIEIQYNGAVYEVQKNGSTVTVNQPSVVKIYGSPSFRFLAALPSLQYRKLFIIENYGINWF